MKKSSLVCCVAALSSVACLLAETLVNIDSLDFKFYPYRGIRDDAREYYEAFVPKTSLAVLANYADVIATGTVVSQNWQDMTVRVDHALAGCSNAQNIVIRKCFDIELAGHYENLFPTNSGNIVFAALAYDNKIPSDYDMSDIVSNTIIPHTNAPLYWLQHDTRQWWYANRDDGILLTQFTNVLQAVRIEPNWTNYYHLLRDGFSSPSNRVKEDSFNDLWCLLLNASSEQVEMILAEPWICSELKEIPRRQIRPHFNEFIMLP